MFDEPKTPSRFRLSDILTGKSLVRKRKRKVMREGRFISGKGGAAREEEGEYPGCLAGVTVISFVVNIILNNYSSSTKPWTL